MLPAYLKGKALALIEGRQRTIARTAGMDDLKARQRYWREHMLGYLGGLP